MLLLNRVYLLYIISVFDICAQHRRRSIGWPGHRPVFVIVMVLHELKSMRFVNADATTNLAPKPETHKWQI